MFISLHICCCCIIIIIIFITRYYYNNIIIIIIIISISIVRYTSYFYLRWDQILIKCISYFCCWFILKSLDSESSY